jgi:hypothetical protein
MGAVMESGPPWQTTSVATVSFPGQPEIGQARPGWQVKNRWPRLKLQPYSISLVDGLDGTDNFRRDWAVLNTWHLLSVLADG